jgi:transcriptional regulator with GAF, ATPase, and Fis domain
VKLRWRTSDGLSGELDIMKKVVTIGTDPTNDLCAPAPGLAAHHVHLLARESHVRVGSIEGHRFSIDGKPETTSVLHEGDRLWLGDLEIELVAATTPEEASLPPAGPASESKDALERLLWFTARLAEIDQPDRLLETLLDLSITVVGAERGLVVLAGDRPEVVATRGVDPDQLPADLGSIPDRLLARACKAGKPLATIQADRDAEFAGSTTVARLGLRAVLALPLAVAGIVRGVLILASSKPGRPFTEAGLNEACLHAALASLLVDHVGRQEALHKEVGELKLGALFGASTVMSRVLKLVERVAPTDLTVLITGETGTGKEMVARQLHRLGARPDGPLVAVNCGAIPEGLVESELFGHARGAFSGAVADRKGRIESADGGTLFLDEIGEMPAAVQVRLLRVLQERVVVRVGESKARPVEFRLILATHRDLAKAVQEGGFRQDLYYRIREFEVRLPPLRERGDDLVMLARHFLTRFSRQYNRSDLTFSPAAMEALVAHDWPGNIRELEGRVKRAAVLAEGRSVEPSHLDLGSEGAVPPARTLDEAVREFRDRFIAGVLALHGGNRTRAAAALGIDPRTLYRHLNREDVR